MDNSDNARLGDANDACAIFRCGRTYLWQLVRDKKLTPIRLGRRMTRYDLAEVHALAASLIAEARNKAD